MPYGDKKFSDVLVCDVYDKIVLKPSQLRKDAKINDAIEQMIANPLSRKVYVVDDDGKYVGTVSTETILRLIGYRVGVRDGGGISFYRSLRDMFKEDVKSIMVKGRAVTKTDTLTYAMTIMMEDHLNDLPVVDAENHLVGELVSLELFLEGRRVFEPKE